MLYTHVYMSEAAKAYARAELDGMCAPFAAANARHGITGMMFYVGDHFVQILEGEREAVWQLLTNIRHDPRNHTFRTLYHGRLTRRRYPRWNMRVMRLNDRVQLPPERLAHLKQSLRFLMEGNRSREAAQRLLSELPRLIPLDYYAALRAS
jgi:hypothetical protein